MSSRAEHRCSDPSTQGANFIPGLQHGVWMVHGGTSLPGSRQGSTDVRSKQRPRGHSGNIQVHDHFNSSHRMYGMNWSEQQKAASASPQIVSYCGPNTTAGVHAWRLSLCLGILCVYCRPPF
jgi:hypothetical protein